MDTPNDLQKPYSCGGVINEQLVSQACGSNGGIIAKVPKSGKLWSAAEDEMLLQVVQTMRPPKWKDVAQYFYRDDWACQNRYEKLMKKRKNP
jgi:nitrate reductase alpha subunit